MTLSMVRPTQPNKYTNNYKKSIVNRDNKKSVPISVNKNGTGTLFSYHECLYTGIQKTIFLYVPAPSPIQYAASVGTGLQVELVHWSGTRIPQTVERRELRSMGYN